VVNAVVTAPLVNLLVDGVETEPPLAWGANPPYGFRWVVLR
jgi:hypothetical protein